jgi:hypothetical protein
MTLITQEDVCRLYANAILYKALTDFGMGVVVLEPIPTDTEDQLYMLCRGKLTFVKFSLCSRNYDLLTSQNSPVSRYKDNSHILDKESKNTEIKLSRVIQAQQSDCKVCTLIEFTLDQVNDSKSHHVLAEQ